MHETTAVVLGCADCHGGDAHVMAPPGLKKTDADYAALRDRAHVLPLYPEAWNFPSSAKPVRSYTLLNQEAPEFVRFVNPSDLRVARLACGACHMQMIQAAERSLMATGAMFMGGASYNNGILPYKNYILGEAYTADGQPAKVVSPGNPPGTITDAQAARGALPALYPLPRWQTTPPADIFRVFERGGIATSAANSRKSACPIRPAIRKRWRSRAGPTSASPIAAPAPACASPFPCSTFTRRA